MNVAIQELPCGDGGGGLGVVKTAMTQRALDGQMSLSCQEVTEGDWIDVTIGVVALREITVRGGEVVLARTVPYRYRHVNAFGVSYTVPARNTDIVSRVIIPVTGPLLTGEHVVHRVAITVPADGPGTVSAALEDIHWAVSAQRSPPQAFGYDAPDGYSGGE